MANQFTSTTFSGTYKDDYIDSDGYHKVLFNSGRALQARELNQLQTILQEQVTRLGNNLFMDGAAVTPKSSGAGCDITDYVIVDSLNLSAGITVGSFIGATLKGTAVTGTDGLIFKITHAIDQVTINGIINKPTLYGRYLSANQEGSSTDVQTTTLTFEETQTLTFIDGSGLPALSVYEKQDTDSQESTGKGVLFTIQGAEFYTQGHFVLAPKQLLAISKYSPDVNTEVGFKVIQDIVTTADTDALYDNQGSRPNLSAPGADRYRIRMILTTQDAIAETEDFVTFASVRNSKIVQIKSGTKNYNEIEKRMAERHAATHGNFIVNDFDIQFRNGDDSDEMIYEIPAADQGVVPEAFLDGYYLPHNVPVEYISPKPLTFESQTSLSLKTEYKNYVSFNGSTQALKDSAIGNFGQTVTALSTQKKLSLMNNAGEVIGNTRLKSIVNRDTDDSDTYRMHLYATQMIGAGNFREVTKITAHDNTSIGAFPVLEESNLYIEEPNINTSLFPIPGGRVKSIDVTEITVQRLTFAEIPYSADAAVNGVLTITCGSQEDLIAKGEWLFINDTKNTVDPIGVGNIVIDPSASGQNQIAEIDTSRDQVNDTQNMYVYHYVQKNAPVARTKTFKEGTFNFTRTTAGDSAGDVFLSNRLDDYDGVELISALDSAAGTIDYVNELEFDGGQRDNYYGRITLLPDGIEDAVTTLTCRVRYFAHGSTGDFFSVNSYNIRAAADVTVNNPIFSYGDIPTYKSPSSGETYVLHDVLDFRPKLNVFADDMVNNQRFEMPKDGSLINFNVEYYNSRVDHVVLGYGDDLKAVVSVNKGEESQQPVPPGIKQDQMILFDVLMNGNTKGVEDITFARRRYRGYKMSDINKLTERVAQIEETISLSALENEASNLVELTSDGTLRSKTGFFVDDFTKGMLFTASFARNEFIDDESFATESLDEENSTIHSRLATEQVSFIYDKNNNVVPAIRGTSAGLTDMVVKGDNVMLDYVSTLDPSMKQEMISWKGSASADYEEHGYYNVNPFNVFQGEGILRLNPARDTWFDNRRLPDKQTNAATVTLQLNSRVIPRTSTFSRTRIEGVWSAGPNRLSSDGRMYRRELVSQRTTTFRTTQQVRRALVSDESVTREIDDKTVEILAVPFMRQRRVFASAEGLRPNTRYWCFMDGIQMEQWVISRTKVTWKTDIANNVHRQALAPTNVNLTTYPGRTSSADSILIADAKGELHFEMWVPNNAPVAIPLSSQYNSLQAWRKWQDQSRRLAQQFGSKSVNTLNQTGWKFRCGTKTVKLLDVSVNNEDACLSLAKSTYTAAGQIRLKQRTMQTTRTRSFDNTLSGNVSTQVGSRTEFSIRTRWFDPLAQSFTVDATEGVPGVFVTEVDVFLHKAPRTGNDGRPGTDLAVPLQLQIRGMTNGIPDSGIISEQHRVYMSADSAYDATYSTGYNLNNRAAVLARPCKMKFKEPVYLRAGEEYAIVLLSESDYYEAYVASTYDLVLGSTAKRVNKQPHKGSLFLSQNGSTWTPKQNQDMAFRIYTAKFKAQGGANFYNNPLEKHMHNFPSSLSVDPARNTHFRVLHIGHGLGQGDSVQMEGLPAGNYRGANASNIQNASNVVLDPTANAYYVELANNATFSTVGNFGSSLLETNRGFPVDRAILNFQDMQFEGCGIRYSASFVSGMSHFETAQTATTDPRFNIDNAPTFVGNGESIFFTTPKYIGNAQQELSEIETKGVASPSVVVGADFFSDQISDFGGTNPTTGQTLTQAKAQGYVSDVSPLIDTQAISMTVTNNVIDNQVLSASDAATSTQNKPTYYQPETHRMFGTALSKHITKVVQLSQPSGGLRVFTDMYVPPAADFDLYYRVGADADTNLYRSDWTLVTKENTPPKSLWVSDEDNMSFAEYRFLIGGTEGDLPDFVSFQLKVVFKTTNTCQSPVMDSIRAIALT